MRIGIDGSRAFVDQPTGTERYAFELITRLVEMPEARNHEWVIYTRNNNENTTLNEFKAKIKTPGQVKVVRIGWPYLWTQLGLAIRTWVDNLDVLWIPAHTLPVLRSRKVKTVVTIHGIEYEWLPAYENRLQRWYLPLSTKYAVAEAEKLIAVSRFTKDQVVERLGGKAEKIEVIHEGYTPESKERVRGKEKELLKKYGLQEEDYLLCVGTVQPRKNLARLVKVFGEVCQAQPRAKLVIAGKLGWGYEPVLEMIKAKNLEERVIITGFVSEADRSTLLRYARFYVQSSITEGFGLPILEAWGAGLAVASSKGGALAEVVGDAGKLFDPTNEQEMVRVLKQLWNSGKERGELMKKGQLRLKHFSWDLAAKQTLQLLVDL